MFSAVKQTASAQLLDQEFMSRAIRLADSPSHCVLPNPRVGAVIVSGTQILGQGFHRGPGLPHAEVEAIRDAEKNGVQDFSSCTLFVTLEPCCHLDKRTPPCSPLVQSKKFARVVVAHRDPNPKVAGRGILQLRQAGLIVDEGCLGHEAQAINQAFLKNQLVRRPYVTLKVAMTFDGQLADDSGKSKWITGPEARRFVHEIRAKVDAVAVGAGTFDHDNPELNARLGLKTFPKQIAIFGRPRRKIAQSRAAKANGTERIISFSSDKRLSQHLKAAYETHKICHLLVEGGPQLAQAFLREKLVDEIILIYGRGFLGGKSTFGLMRSSAKSQLSKILSFIPDETKLMGPDVMVRGKKHVYRTH